MVDSTVVHWGPLWVARSADLLAAHWAACWVEQSADEKAGRKVVKTAARRDTLWAVKKARNWASKTVCVLAAWSAAKKVAKTAHLRAEQLGSLRAA